MHQLLPNGQIVSCRHRLKRLCFVPTNRVHLSRAVNDTAKATALDSASGWYVVDLLEKSMTTPRRLQNRTSATPMEMRLLRIAHCSANSKTHGKSDVSTSKQWQRNEDDLHGHPLPLSLQRMELPPESTGLQVHTPPTSLLALESLAFALLFVLSF